MALELGTCTFEDEIKVFLMYWFPFAYFDYT